MKVLIILAVVFAIGVMFGSKTASPDVDFVKVPTTKIVKEPAPPPVTKYEWPEDCQDALDYAYVIHDEANGIYDSGTDQLQIISDGRIAIAGYGDLSAVENKQRALQETTVGHLGKLEEAFAAYTSSYEKCKATKD